jgi:gliding motility-associatede transport system auxiliary component
MASKSSMKTKQTKFAAYTTVYILIVLAVVGGVNFLANRYDKTFDTTANKKFTLSDQTDKIAKDLKQNINITYWDRPTQFQAAHDLLDRYQNLSSKINVHYMDAEKNRTAAIAAGVKQLGTIQVNTGTKQEEAKSLTEEEVTGALVRAIKNGERTACFVLGSGEHSIDDADRGGYSQAKALLEANNYKTQTIKLLENPEIPKDCLIVVVPGPTHDYLQREVDAIKTYVEKGGRAFIMLDPPLQFAKQQTDENAELVKVLKDWGVTADKDLVLDTSGVGQIFGMGPEVPLVTGYGTHAIVKAMKDVPSGFPISRSLEVKNGAKTTVEKLFDTSENSFATKNLKSAEIKPSASDMKGPLTLGAAGTYNGEGTKGQFVVVGSSSWIANSFLRFNGNRDLFLNSMNWLSSDEDLISIRPKDTEDRRLTMSTSQMRLVAYSSVVGIPLLIIFAGVGMWWRRR